MIENNQKHLLPVGFYDLLFDEAKINQESTDILLKKFADSGYSLIKTPLVEFEETLQNNQKLKEQSFKMIDISSGKTLVIRSDITPQIVRLLSTRLKNEPLPLRLCYAGDVLKVKNDDLYSDRQLTQVGIELIGDQFAQASQEVIEIIIQGLNAIKLPNLLIDFCLPQFLDSLLAELKIKEKQLLAVAIRKKNVSVIRNLGGKYAESLINLTLQIDDFDIINNELANLPISKVNKEKVKNLQRIINNIKQNYSKISILINVFDDSDFLYHNDIGFTIFEEMGGVDAARDVFYPIARGGKYNVDDKIPAVGATVYINNLRKILAKSSLYQIQSLM